MPSRRRVPTLLAAVWLLGAGTTFGAEGPVWEQAGHNGELARQCLLRSRDYVRGWLAHADPVTGLIPRNLTESRDFWNGRDAAADNYSFMVLTCALVGRDLFESVGGYPEIPLMEDIALSRLLKRRGRPLCLEARVRTSARRWVQGGVARTTLLMWRLRLAYFFGAEPSAEAVDRQIGMAIVKRDWMAPEGGDPHPDVRRYKHQAAGF